MTSVAAAAFASTSHVDSDQNQTRSRRPQLHWDCHAIVSISKVLQQKHNRENGGFLQRGHSQQCVCMYIFLEEMSSFENMIGSFFFKIFSGVWQSILGGLLDFPPFSMWFSWRFSETTAFRDQGRMDNAISSRYGQDLARQKRFVSHGSPP